MPYDIRAYHFCHSWEIKEVNRLDLQDLRFPCSNKEFQIVIITFDLENSEFQKNPHFNTFKQRFTEDRVLIRHHWFSSLHKLILIEAPLTSNLISQRTRTDCTIKRKGAITICYNKFSPWATMALDVYISLGWIIHWSLWTHEILLALFKVKKASEDHYASIESFINARK